MSSLLNYKEFSFNFYFLCVHCRIYTKLNLFCYLMIIQIFLCLFIKSTSLIYIIMESQQVSMGFSDYVMNFNCSQYSDLPNLRECFWQYYSYTHPRERQIYSVLREAISFTLLLTEIVYFPVHNELGRVVAYCSLVSTGQPLWKPFCLPCFFLCEQEKKKKLI